MEKSMRVYTYRTSQERARRRRRARIRRAIKLALVETAKEVVCFIFYNLSSILKLVFLLGVATVGQIMINKLTFYERGYHAMGGEVFLFPFILGLGYLLLFHLPEKYEWYD